MRVASFNIHHGTVGRRGPVDPDQLGAVCAAFEADVIGLQEVDVGTVRVRGADLAGAVAAATGMDHVFGSSQRHLGGQYGNALLVRGELGERRVVRLPKVPGYLFWQEQRTVLLASARLGSGVDLELAVTHLAVKGWNNGPQLDALLELLRGARAPLVAVGDLNRRTEAVQPQVEAAGLALVEHGPTYPASGPTITIDHVVVSPSISVRHVEVRPTAMSDHAALIVDLDLDPGR